jgi:PiT family inorganic phosphate transporter
MLVLWVCVRNPALYAEPKGKEPPPLWIRSLLIGTCTAVSFAHGSNDGQKGMGLIMLILIGVVPTAYALNKTPAESQIEQFKVNSVAAAAIIDAKSDGRTFTGDPRPLISKAIATHTIADETLPAVGALVVGITQEVGRYGSYAKLPSEAVANTRNDMYLASQAMRFLIQDKAQLQLSENDVQQLTAYKASLDEATRYIPLWVKITVAIALGLGTMVGWKRIVVTVGEKIGKTHMTYAQGAAAEVVTAGTIGLADVYGLPVSTTHVLSSGVAGTMAASGAGLQMATVRNLLLAWVLTLPVAILLSASLYWLFVQIF